MRINSLLLIAILLFSSCAEESDKILFSSNRDGNSDIYLMDSEGENLQQITNSDFDEWSPVWVSERNIVFLRQLKDSIIVVDKNLENNYERILNHPAECILDDKNFVFYKSMDKRIFSCKGDVFLMLDSKVTNLTATLDGTANYIAWHNGNEILFTSNHEGTNDIYKININDLDTVVKLTDTQDNNERGSMSPNGRFLAFSSDMFKKGQQDIVIMDLMVKEYINITRSEGNELIARWSKNGKYLYYGGNETGDWEIYRFDTNTNKTIQLTKNKAFDGDPRPYLH
ncbi:MAG: hypothetical protein ED556_08245 [Winogradskyella sp.]|uniref:TolB family protein n=1 Tax=Winogradskyella sp. TaxID=1883156 RepID=UPI000F3EB770|nr:hypothetical protein [Winogradskyella sp.]RNC86277.1 MAG: hypothetical protein ED556_08245 [Winogradskyella sp.]